MAEAQPLSFRQQAHSVATSNSRPIVTASNLRRGSKEARLRLRHLNQAVPEALADTQVAHQPLFGGRIPTSPTRSVIRKAQSGCNSLSSRKSSINHRKLATRECFACPKPSSFFCTTSSYKTCLEAMYSHKARVEVICSHKACKCSRGTGPPSSASGLPLRSTLTSVSASAASASFGASWPGARGQMPGSQHEGSSSQQGPGSQEDSSAPSCMFLGPLEAADQSSLEEFYRQAKDSYYSGNPLIVDEMFDRVEVHLRWLRSPVVQKYPRCSLQSFTTYSDAKEDPSQMSSLFGIWGLLLALGGSLAVGPTLLTAHFMWTHITSEDAALGIAYLPGPILTSTWFMLCAISTALGLAVSRVAASTLQDLRAGSLMALTGTCPACTEDVYAFVKVDGREKRPKHKTECHVCGQRLVFHAVLRPKPTTSSSGQLVDTQEKLSLEDEWVYGRVYTLAKPEDLKPN